MEEKDLIKLLNEFIRNEETTNYGETTKEFFDKYDRSSLIDKLEKIKNYIKKEKKRFVIAGTLAGTVSLAYAISSAPKYIPKKDYLYLMELKTDDLNLYDEDKNIIENTIDITNKMYVVTTTDHSFDFYNSYIINNIGEIQSCYVKKENINFSKKLDKVECPIEISDESEIDVVAPNDGCWIRKEKIVDKNTNDAKLLETGSYVIAASTSTTSKDNDYYWKNTIYVDVNNKKLYDGYMIDGYLINSDFDKASGIKFEILQDLNIRDDASLNGNIITRLKKEEKVILVPNLPSITNDNIDWFYIAYNSNNKINFGYCAATEYLEKPISYLKECDNSFLYDENYYSKKIDFSNIDKEKMIGKLVDFKGSGASNLKLRVNPGLDSDIIHYLENDTYVYTFESEIDNTVLKDGYNWLKIYLIDGTCGYVAQEYLKDYTYETSNKEPRQYIFDNKKIKGYFGVDVDINSDPSIFEKLITTGNLYTDSYPSMNETRKIDFAIIKLGSSGTLKGEPIIRKEEIYENINSLTNVCEKTNTKYGMYYYSQAITKDDADMEIEEIKRLIEKFDLKSKNNMVLPFYIDIEEKLMGEDTRVKKSALNNGKDYQTKICNYLMNELRKETNLEVCLYTDHNTLESTINFDKLDEDNKKNCWIVETSVTHTTNLTNNQPIVYEYMKMRQTEIDKSVFINDTDNEIKVDFDIMDEDFYNNHIK